MKYTINAIAPHSGWGIVTWNGEMNMLSPPYEKGMPLTHKDLEKALDIYGFEVCEKQWDQFNEVIDFLKEEYISFQELLGKEVPSQKDLEETLQFLPEEELREFLQWGEQELIPQKKFDAAESVALNILKSDLAVENQEIHQLALNLMEKSKIEKAKLNQFATETKKERWEKKFPRSAKKYSIASIRSFVQNVQNHGSLIRVGV